jgi:hypothetical protein
MKINQLFKDVFKEEDANALATCFGLISIHDTSLFCKSDLQNRGTVQKIKTQYMTMLETYYFPCKAKIYLQDLDEQKCITVFRQILRTFHLALKSVQKYSHDKKISYYFISSADNENKGVTKLTQANIRVEF